jgi:hypothetical protein
VKCRRRRGRDVRRLEKVGDDGQQVGAGVDQLRGVLQGDAADGADRQAELGAGRASRPSGARTAAGLVGEAKKLPKAT